MNPSGSAPWPRFLAPGLALLSGAAMAAGQVPWSLWPLALVGLAGLLWLLERADSAGAAARLAGVAGVAHFAIALGWIVNPFWVEAETYGWMAPFAVLAMGLGGGAFWALPVWALRRSLGAGPLVMVLALGLSDLARGYVLTGFPWALIGHVWLGTPVAQFAALGGAVGLSLLTLCLAALLAMARPRPVALALVTFALAWSGGAMILRGPEPVPQGARLRLVQPAAEQRLKWEPSLARQHFQALLDETAAPAKGRAPDLTIWPETALPYLLERNPEVAALIAGASGGRPVALGVQRVDGQRGWNSLRVQDGTGALLAAYDKHHLVPFGEYIPFGDRLYDWFGLRAFAAQLGHAYSAGPGPQVLDLPAPLGRVLPLICYEAVFPQDLRTGGERADWILQITNDAWFGTASGPFQHAALARLRAIELGLPLVRVANTGVSEVVDARGRVVASLPFGTRGHLDADLPGKLGVTPYARWGEGPVLLWLCGIGVLALRRRVFSLP